MIEQNSVLMKAAQHALSEELGFDEGRAYFYLLTGKKKEFEQEYSYSKRYRLLKELYENGAVGKIKPSDKDFFSYFLLPPTFLALLGISERILKFLENIYFSKYMTTLDLSFSQIMIKDEKSLVLFLLKYLMKDYAKIITGDIDLMRISGIRREKITIKTYEEKMRRKIGVIDGKIGFELSSIINRDSYDYVGCITNSISKGVREDYISGIEKEFDRCAF